MIRMANVGLERVDRQQRAGRGASVVFRLAPILTLAITAACAGRNADVVDVLGGGGGANASGQMDVGGNPGTIGVGVPPPGSATSSGVAEAGAVTQGTTQPRSGVPANTTVGPHFAGSGTSFRPLTTGCGPNTSGLCTGTCEQQGGDPNVTVLRRPQTLCFAGEGDETPDDPSVVIEQVIERLGTVEYLHVRVTFDPAFVDTTYGEGSCSHQVTETAHLHCLRPCA